MHPPLLSYYEAIEQASAGMLDAARSGDWREVAKLEAACLQLISRLKQAARGESLAPDEARLKSLILQRIVANDAAIRTLADPWLKDLDPTTAGCAPTVH